MKSSHSINTADLDCKKINSDFKIHYLKDRVDDIPTLVRWFEDEWSPWYGPNGNGNAKADLLECCNHNKLPIALAAINDTGNILGTIALKTESLGYELGYSPWLAALFVYHPYRRQGIGSALITAMESEARGLGFEKIYISTDIGSTLLSGRKWKLTGDQMDSLRGQVLIYSKDL